MVLVASFFIPLNEIIIANNDKYCNFLRDLRVIQQFLIYALYLVQDTCLEDKYIGEVCRILQFDEMAYAGSHPKGN